MHHEVIAYPSWHGVSISLTAIHHHCPKFLSFNSFIELELHFQTLHQSDLFNVQYFVFNMITKDTTVSDNNSPGPVHILVLETDEPHPETQTRKGSFGEILHDLFTEAGNNHSPPLSVKTSMHYIVDDPKNNNHGSVPSITSIPSTTKAILITGSVYDAHGSDPWILSLLSLLHELWQTRPDMQFAGICFGHQILARLLGASVNAHPSGDWELGTSILHLSQFLHHQTFHTT